MTETISMHNCPASPNCPYCDDDGEWERQQEEADEESRLDAQGRGPDDDDQPPFNDDVRCPALTPETQHD